MKIKLLSGIVIAIILIIGGFFVWTYSASKDSSGLSNTSNASSTQAQIDKVKALVASVSKLILVPQGEDPTVAIINDAAALTKQQPFYTGSQNGDLVLIFQKAAKVIIYSPTRNIIVNVGPILPPDQTQPKAKVSTTSSSATTTK